MLPQRVAEIDKLSLQQFATLPQQERRTYARVPLPEQRVRELMADMRERAASMTKPNRKSGKGRK